MRLKSLPDDAKVYEVFARRPDTFQPFVEACEKIMRGPSALSAADRELLGAFVSSLNACPYCHDVHNESGFTFMLRMTTENSELCLVCHDK